MPSKTRLGFVKRTDRWERASNRLSQARRDQFPVKRLLAFLKRVGKISELELLETTPKKHTTLSCYRDGALPGRFNLPEVHWTLDAFVYLGSEFRHRGGFILHLLSVHEFEGMERDPAETFTLAKAEDKYGKFLNFLKLDNTIMSEAKQAFLPGLWPARETRRSERREEWLNDPEWGAWVSDMPRAMVGDDGAKTVVGWKEVLLRGKWHMSTNYAYTDYAGKVKTMATQGLLKQVYDWLNRHPNFNEEKRAKFKRSLFARLRDPEVHELLPRLTEPECEMFLALRGIVRGGGPSADDGGALEQPTNFRILWSREAQLLHWFLKSQPLPETEEEKREREERGERQRQKQRRKKKKKKKRHDGEPDKPPAPQEAVREYSNQHGRGAYLPYLQEDERFARIDATIFRALMRGPFMRRVHGGGGGADMFARDTMALGVLRRMLQPRNAEPARRRAEFCRNADLPTKLYNPGQVGVTARRTRARKSVVTHRDIRLRKSTPRANQGPGRAPFTTRGSARMDRRAAATHTTSLRRRS